MYYNQHTWCSVVLTCVLYIVVRPLKPFLLVCTVAGWQDERTASMVTDLQQNSELLSSIKVQLYYSNSCTGSYKLLYI